MDQKLISFILIPNPALIIDTGTALDRDGEASISRSPWRTWAFSGCPLSKSLASKITLGYFYDSAINTLISRLNNTSAEYIVYAISYH